MTRPTILDLDLVVVPREPAEEMFLDPDDICVNFGESPWDAFKRHYTAMLSASPYTTAWDDVRQYVEGLEAARKEADHKLVDRYRNPKTGTFSFPDDVAAIVRSLDAAEARIAELEKRLADAERLREAHDDGVKFGIALSIAFLLRDRDKSVIAEEWWRAAGLTVEECERIGVDEYDLSPIRAAMDDRT